MAGRRIIVPWQTRTKLKPADETNNDDSSQENEENEEQEEEELVLPAPCVAYNDAARDPISYPYPSSSTVHMSTMPEQTSWEGNHLNIPTFPGANQFSQTTNTAPPESTYPPGYPSTSVHQNIYSAAGYPFDFASGNTNPFLYNLNPEATIPAQMTDTVLPNSIYSAGYPSAFAPSNIYTTSNYPVDSAASSIYPAPMDHCTITAVASEFGNLPLSTNSVAMLHNPYIQPNSNIRHNIDEVWQGDFGLHRPDLPACHEPHPPSAAPQSTQPIATAISTPVLPEESATTAISSPAEDPFMGADWSPEMAEDWQ